MNRHRAALTALLAKWSDDCRRFKKRRATLTIADAAVMIHNKAKIGRTSANQ
jgi:hypothetical protein